MHPNSLKNLLKGHKFQKGNKVNLVRHWVATPEYREKRRQMALARGFGQWMKGKKQSETSNQKRREASLRLNTAKTLNHLKGMRSAHWQGGITSVNAAIRNSARYGAWRSGVFERDHYKCRMPNCRSNSNELEAHHIKPFSKHPNLRLEVNNGITLHKACHSRIKGKEEQYEPVFTNILAA